MSRENDASRAIWSVFRGAFWCDRIFFRRVFISSWDEYGRILRASQNSRNLCVYYVILTFCKQMMHTSAKINFITQPAIVKSVNWLLNHCKSLLQTSLLSKMFFQLQKPMCLVLSLSCSRWWWCTFTLYVFSWIWG